MPEQVGVIGAGSWGTTLAKVLGENDVDVLLWARHEELAREIDETRANARYLPGFTLPRRVRATADLEQVCATRQLLLLVVLTALAGASAIGTGAMLLFGAVETADFTQASVTKELDDDWWWYVSYLVLAVAGLVAQLQMISSIRTSMRDDWAAAGGKSFRGAGTS